MNTINRMWLCLATVALLGIAGMAANAQIGSPIRSVVIPPVNRTAWQYARLVINEDIVLWHAGETNLLPEALALDVQYRQLGGNSQPNLTNLLNLIGIDGWELVATNESVWTFKRPQRN